MKTIQLFVPNHCKNKKEYLSYWINGGTFTICPNPATNFCGGQITIRSLKDLKACDYDSIEFIKNGNTDHFMRI